jgi:hypothetical protein
LLNEKFLKDYYDKKDLVAAKEELVEKQAELAVVQQLEKELADAKEAVNKMEAEKRTQQFLHLNLRVCFTSFTKKIVHIFALCFFILNFVIRC